MGLLVRSWNLYHGNAKPPERRAFLEEMIRLVTEDRPDVICLQEVPVWAVHRLERWSDMHAVGVVAEPPRLRSATLGHRVTRLHHGRFRSALTGQAVAILVARQHPVSDTRSRVVSRSGERRVCQSVRIGGGLSVTNFHVTGGEPADGQFRAVADFVEEEDGAAVLAGDVNLRPGEGETYRVLRERGFSAPLEGSIDQILVRGLAAAPVVAWPEERRRLNGRLLSDHAPVETVVG
jgi:endonuclease/exonuclease/phosphatase family metal-dependent hydrolase